MLSTRYLALYLALFGVISAVSLPLQAVELMKWQRIPLQVPLSVGQERIIFVNKNVRVGFPPQLNGKLRIQSTGGTVYLQASSPFSTTRLSLQDVDNGELILLDISALESKQIREPVELIYQGDVFHATASDSASVSLDNSRLPTGKVTDKNKQSVTAFTAPLPILLTRYAAQRFYAPARTLEPLPGIQSLSHGLPATLSTLLPSEAVTVNPLAAWGLQEYKVVALKLTNQRADKVVLDPRHLQGSFYAATFQHHWLGAAGTPEDTTLLYLVMRGRPDAAFLPEPVIPEIKKSASASSNEVTHAN